MLIIGFKSIWHKAGAFNNNSTVCFPQAKKNFETFFEKDFVVSNIYLSLWNKNGGATGKGHENKMTTTQISIALMSWGSVKKYLNENGFQPSDRNFEFYISIEATGPYDQLTGENTYVLTSDVAKFVEGGSKNFFRKMECVVVTFLSDKRFFLKLNEASIRSIEL